MRKEHTKRRRTLPERLLSLGLAAVLALTGMPAIEAKAAGNPIGDLYVDVHFPVAGQNLVAPTQGDISGADANVTLSISKFYEANDATMAEVTGTAQEGKQYALYMKLNLTNAQGDYFDVDTTRARITKNGSAAAGKLATCIVEDEGNNIGYYLHIRYTFVVTGQHTISFVTYHGPEKADQGVNDGTLFNIPAALVAEGYEFRGWYKDSGFATPYVPEQIQGDMTLYARWDPSNYTISYDVNGADNKTGNETIYDNVTFAYDTDITGANPNNNVETGYHDLTKEGYEFTGWALYHADGTAFDAVPTTMPAENVTWKAVFDPIEYDIIYNANKAGARFYAASDTSYTSVLTSEQLAALSTFNKDSAAFNLPILAADGTDEFLGWYFDPSDTDSVSAYSSDASDFYSNAVYNGTSGRNELTLTAKWGIRKYNLEWNLNGGSLVDPDADYTGKTNASVAYNTAVTFPVPKRDYYDLVSWTDTSSSTEIALADVASYRMPNRSASIRADWEPHAYNISYVVGTNDRGQSVGGWHTWQTITQQNNGVVPDWSASGVDGTDPYKVTALPIIKSENNLNVTNNAYTFGGWYASNRLTGYSTFYNGKYGNSSEREPLVADYPVTQTGHDDYLSDHAIWENSGWKEEDKVSAIDASTAALIVSKGAGDTLTLYCRWIINKPELTWDFGGGTPAAGYAPEATSDGRPISYPVGDQITLPTAMTKTGYAFTGWEFYYDNAADPMTDSEKTSILNYNASAGTLDMPNKKLNIKGTYSEIPYTVTYDLNVKATGWKNDVVWSGNVGEETFKITSANLSLKNPDASAVVTPGYEFVGWYDGTLAVNATKIRALNPDTATDADYTNLGEAVANIPSGSTENRTLIAVWRRKTYNAVWSLNGAVLNVGDTSVQGFTPGFTYAEGTNAYTFSAKYNAVITAPDLSGKREGYDFKGWYVKTGTANAQGTINTADIPENYAPASLSLASTMPADITTFYAVWEPHQYSITYTYDPSMGDFAADVVKPTYFTIDKSTTLPDLQPAEIKYEFKGWYTSPESSTTGWNEDDKLVDNRIPAGFSPLQNLTVYARFSVIQKTLSWNFNGGTSDAASVGYTKAGSHDYGKTIVFPNLTKAGYNFVGWTITAAEEGDNPESEVEADIENGVLNVPAGYEKIYRNLTITARFDPIVYTIIYHPDTNENGYDFGGFATTDNVIETYTVESLTQDYRIPTHKASTVLDRTFYGWYLGERPANPLSEASSKKKVELIRKGQVLVTGTTEVHLYAVWITDENYAAEVARQLETIRSMLASFRALLVNGEVTLNAQTGNAIVSLKQTLDSSKNMAKAQAGVTETLEINNYYSAYESLADAQSARLAQAVRAIGTVTCDSVCKGKIDNARTLYDEAIELPLVVTLAKEKFRNIETTLLNAESEYERLVVKNEEDTAASEAVLQKIQAISDKVALTNKDKQTIDTAVAAYEALTADQKAMLPSSAVTRMYAASTAYATMAKTYSDNQAAIRSAEAAMGLVPTNVTLTDENKTTIENARAAYDRLTTDQKALVDSALFSRLQKAETTYNKLKKAADEKQFKEDYSKWDKENTSVKEIAKKIKKTKTDQKNVSGAQYSVLKLKATAKKTSIKLTWKKVKKADGYQIYGGEYGGKMKLLAEVGKKAKKWTHTKAATDTYYKYIVVAYSDAKKYKTKKVLTTSETVYAATLKSKLANVKNVLFEEGTRSVLCAPGDSFSVSADVVLTGESDPLIGIRYESSNKKAATIDKNGNIKCKKAGKAVIYAISQSGKAKSFKVLVKK
ncbi:MAG: InlB B-repeat-containing protein [Lachnospiraceae bacterium]|nr:InlB B-repeat-containing protein [Lachnospiraceae bacterium]